LPEAVERRAGSRRRRIPPHRYEEAVANAQRVIAAWIEQAEAMGRPIPDPKGRVMSA